MIPPGLRLYRIFRLFDPARKAAGSRFVCNLPRASFPNTEKTLLLKKKKNQMKYPLQDKCFNQTRSWGNKRASHKTINNSFSRYSPQVLRLNGNPHPPPPATSFKKRSGGSFIVYISRVINNPINIPLFSFASSGALPIHHRAGIGPSTWAKLYQLSGENEM